MSTNLLSSDDRIWAENLIAPSGERKSAGGRSLPIRLECIADRCLDDGMSCGMILHKFAARSVDQVAALERALDSGNALELARGAHALKGVAADLSAETLCALADQLQRTAERGELDEAAGALVRTREEIERCVEAASELLGQLLREHRLDA
jgi:HPt (histidine-containing phosphotransfer) domain-containing protein